MMTLYFKHAKCFVAPSDDAGNGTRKYLGQAGPTPTPNVPFWVADTDTFKRGIKDGTIIQLTPTVQMEAYERVKKAKLAAALAEPAKAEEKAPEEPVREQTPEEAEEQVKKELEAEDNPDPAKTTEAPATPFGGQPLTPVQPGPKLGMQGKRR